MRIQWTRRLRVCFISCILGGVPLTRIAGRNRMNIARTTKAWLVTTALILVAGISWCAEPEKPLVGRWLVQRVGLRDATKLPIQTEWEFTKDKVIVRDVTNSQEVSRNSYTLDLT